MKALGLADMIAADAAAGVAGADLVILCVPVMANAALAAAIGPHLAEGTILSDVGSVKGAVARDITPHLPAHVQFVPAHPVAGTEHSGPDAGFAELFTGKWCILTPADRGRAGGGGTAESLLEEGIGSNVENHDTGPP